MKGWCCGAGRTQTRHRHKGPSRSTEGSPEAVLASRWCRQEGTERSDTVKAAAGSSPADPEPATQQQAGRGSCPAAEPGHSPQQREAAGWAGSARDRASLYAGILLLSRFREARKSRGAASALRPSASGWSAQVCSCAVTVWGRPEAFAVVTSQSRSEHWLPLRPGPEPGGKPHPSPKDCLGHAL